MAGREAPGLAALLCRGRVSGRGPGRLVPSPGLPAPAAVPATCRLEGIVPAGGSPHAIAHVMRIAPGLPADTLIVLGLSGRGDKDVFTVAAALGQKL